MNIFLVFFLLMQFIGEGVFIYLTLYSQGTENNEVKPCEFKNVFNFLIFYVPILFLYKYIFNNNMFYRVISFLLILIYILIKHKRTKDWKFAIIYSSFICIVIESINFILFKMFTISYKMYNIPKKSDSMIVWIITVIINFCIFLLLYKCKFIKLENLRKLSVYKYLWLGVPSVLLCVLYMKYYIKHYCNEAEGIGIILSNFLLLFIPIFLFFVGVVSKISEKRNKEQNEIDENKIHNAINTKGLNLPNNFDPEIFEYNCKLIKRKLSKFKVHESRQGFYQMVFCISIIKFMEGKKVVLFRNVYPVLSDIINVDIKLIDTNIRNLINETWSSTDPEILQKEYKRPINENRGHPTAREFLIYIANNLES